MKEWNLTEAQAHDVADAYMKFTGVEPESLPILFDIIEINFDITCADEVKMDEEYWVKRYYGWIESQPKDPAHF